MRGMNGSTGTSSSDSRGYPGGIPPPGGPLLGPLGGSLASMGIGGGGPPQPGGPPPPGLGGLPPGSVGAAAAAAAAAGLGVGSPEFKNHADFLSRLLAATPSYMNEVGNPPPGFFSDWLRRLVSKPSGNGGGGCGSLQSQGLTFPGGGQAEVESGGRPRSGGGGGGGGGGSNMGNGASSSGVPSTTPNSSSLDAQMSSKRRKRSRLSDHPEHPLGTDGDNNGRPGSRSSGGMGSSNGHPVPSLPPPSSIAMSGSSGSPPSSSTAAALAAAAALQPLGAYPFWFFPPFMTNPYGMGMNMGMNFPPHPGHPGTSPGGGGGGGGHSGGLSAAAAAAAQAAALSSYLGGGGGVPSSPSELFRTDNLNLFSGSITAATGGRGGHTTSPHSSLSHPFHPPPGVDGSGSTIPPPHHLSGGTTMSHHHHLKMSRGEGKGKSESPPGLLNRKDPSPSSSSYLSAAAAASASFLMGSGGSVTSGLGPSSTKTTTKGGGSPSPSSLYGGGTHNGVGKVSSNAKSPPVSGANHTKGSSNSKSFSISRLTSPSPSSSTSSSGGSVSGSSSSRYAHHNKAGRNSTYDQQELRALQQQYSGYGEQNSVLKANLTSPPGSKSTTSSAKEMKSYGGDSGVDLRVGGRMWEGGSSVSASGRSVYAPLSAFRDPTEALGGTSSRGSPQVPTRYDHTHHHHTHKGDRGASPMHPHHASSLHHPLPEQLNLMKQGTSAAAAAAVAALASSSAHPYNKSPCVRSANPLSTGNVFRSLQHIYQQIRPSTARTSPSSPNQITSHPINNHHSPPPPTTSGSTTTAAKNYHTTINHHQTTTATETKNSLGDSPAGKCESDDVPSDIRPHSSSSSVLDDDDFKPESELEKQSEEVDEDTLNLSSLNNNNIDKKDVGGGGGGGKKKSKKGEGNKGQQIKGGHTNSKGRVNDDTAGQEEPARVLKRRFSMSCEEADGDDDGFDEQIQEGNNLNYRYVDGEGRIKKRIVKGKDNNNESCGDEEDFKGDKDKIDNDEEEVNPKTQQRFPPRRVSISEKGEFDDEESNDSLNLMVDNDGGESKGSFDI